MTLTQIAKANVLAARRWRRLFASPNFTVRVGSNFSCFGPSRYLVLWNDNWYVGDWTGHTADKMEFFQ